MTRRARASLFLGALVALPGSATAKDICAALADFVAASREAQPFASVRRALAQGDVIVSVFEVRDCHADSGGISCDDISFNTANFDAWPEPLNCPGAIATAVLDPIIRRRERQHAYLLSGLRLEYGFACWGCAGGPHAFFSFSFQGRTRPRH